MGKHPFVAGANFGVPARTELGKTSPSAIRDMNLESDSQEYTLNWVSRLDRRNVVLSAHCLVDIESRFILGLYANYDGGAAPFAVNAEATRIRSTADS